jgi:hypothetical protein
MSYISISSISLSEAEEFLQRRKAYRLSLEYLPHSFDFEVSQLSLTSVTVDGKPKHVRPVISKREGRKVSNVDMIARQRVADPDNYHAQRAQWPDSPHSINALEPREIVRTGSVMVGFDPAFRRPKKPVTNGSEYPAKCAHARAVHEEREAGQFTLMRAEERLEQASLPFAPGEQRKLFAPTSPLNPLAAGVPRMLARRDGMMATAQVGLVPLIEDRPLTPLRVRALAAAESARHGRPPSRQQPDIPSPFHEVAPLTIFPGFQHRPRTPGVGLPSP